MHYRTNTVRDRVGPTTCHAIRPTAKFVLLERQSTSLKDKYPLIKVQNTFLVLYFFEGKYMYILSLCLAYLNMNLTTKTAKQFYVI